MVANAAPTASGSSSLVELKLSSLKGTSLHLGTPDGPLLAQAPLPYIVPIEGA